LRGRNRVMATSVVPNGEYGLEKLSIGLPVVLGKNGVEKIIELPLDDGTKSQLKESEKAIRTAIERLGLSPRSPQA